MTVEEQIRAALTALYPHRDSSLLVELVPVVAAVLQKRRLEPAGEIDLIHEVVDHYLTYAPLVHGLASKDNEAVNSLIKMLYPQAISLLYKQVQGLDRLTVEEWATEITHRTILTLREKTYLFDRSFEAMAYLFLYNITRNFLRTSRSAKRRLNQESLALKDELFKKAAHMRPLEQDIATAENRAEVLRAIHRLPDNQRLVIVAHFFDGLSLKEIAAGLGTSPNNVYQLKFKGLKKLGQWLRDDDE